MSARPCVDAVPLASGKHAQWVHEAELDQLVGECSGAVTPRGTFVIGQSLHAENKGGLYHLSGAWRWQTLCACCMDKSWHSLYEVYKLAI